MNCSIAASSYPVRRNTVLLSACLLLLSGVLQLAVAVATITLVLVTGIESILGLGPVIQNDGGKPSAPEQDRHRQRNGEQEGHQRTRTTRHAPCRGLSELNISR